MTAIAGTMDLNVLIRKSVALPFKTAQFGIRTTASILNTAAEAAAAVTAASVSVSVSVSVAVSSKGLALVNAPMRRTGGLVQSPLESGVRMAIEAVGGMPVRRYYRGPGRAWIEVRGLAGDGGQRIGDGVLSALRAHPGVTSVHLNYPLARVLVRFGEIPPPLGALFGLIEDIEQREERARRDANPLTRAPYLAADHGLTANRLLAAGMTALGLQGALAGRALRLPRLPLEVGAIVSAANYQPVVRKLLEDRFGHDAADKMLSVANLASRTFGQVPASLAGSLAMRLAAVAEIRATARSWQRHESALAHGGECTENPRSPERAEPRGRVEQHMDRSALAQAIGSAAVGVLSGSAHTAAKAALTALPKAARTTRESFASTFGRVLADEHDALALRPAAWRLLDRVDVVVVDPRALCTSELRIAAIRGADERDRAAVWERAQARLDAGTLSPGWRPIEGPWGDVEVAVRRTHDPMASAVVAEAHRAGVEIVSVDTGDVGELRSAFDDLWAADGPIDDALAAAVAAHQEAGRTVAVVTSGAAQACCLADVAIGVIDIAAPPPWHADVMVNDLVTVWRILHALPVAKAASRRGVELSTGASLLGVLLIVPGVRGRGAGPVTVASVAGQVSGYLMARRSLRARVPEPAPTQDWHAMTPDQVRRALPQSVCSDGLGEAEGSGVGRVLSHASRSASGFVGAVRAELSDPLTPVLATGSAASALLGSPIDAVLVGSVLVGNAVLAATQRLHAERTLRRLLNVQQPKARKVFGDDRASIPAGRLRPGDVIEVRSEEVVPADARVLEVCDVEVDESSLTGESLPVVKHVDATPGAPLAERSCMLFAGSTVVSGTALAIVTAVGPQTQAERAAVLAHSQGREVGLQTQLRQLTNRVWPISLAGGAVVTALGLLRGAPMREAVSSGVAVSVAAVPEGLPLVATLAQQASARRLTKQGVLVRTPRSVEALGRVDTVCFDKTGTLSENRLRVTDVKPLAKISADEVLAHAAAAGPQTNGAPQPHATDTAITDAAHERAGFDTAQHKPTAHLPFRPGRPYSASVSGTTLMVKGAPEVVLKACPTANGSSERSIREMAAHGLRVIAVASGELTEAQAQAARENPEILSEFSQKDLRLDGLLGLSDTPRKDAPGLLRALADREIAVRLVTGDHPLTAAAIATDLGLAVGEDEVVTGSEWEDMSRREQEQVVVGRLVFARMSPEHKVQIVQTLERTGRTCAMVGDGVNDAAAIRAATVGIGIAAKGSAPARSASDVMLLDGRIESLLDALSEGQQLWQRVRAAVSVLLGGNAGEVLFAVIGSAVTGRSPLNARQLLLVNMLTDALPAAALAVSPPADEVDPTTRGYDEAALWRAVALRGASTAGGASAAWLLARFTGRRRRAATVALVALVASQLGQTVLDSRGKLVVLTAVGSLAAMGVVISTPGVSQLVGCTPLGPVGWAQALGCATAATVAAAGAPKVLEFIAPQAKSSDA